MTCIPGDIGSVLHRVEFQPNWNLLETERDTYGVSAFARQIHNFTGCASYYFFELLIRQDKMIKMIIYQSFFKRNFLRIGSRLSQDKY